MNVLLFVSISFLLCVRFKTLTVAFSCVFPFANPQNFVEFEVTLFQAKNDKFLTNQRNIFTDCN